MRFYNPEDEAKLTRMVVDGAVNRDVLEKAVGERTVALIDALVQNASKLQSQPWIAWGIRQGLARLDNTKVTAAFLRELRLSSSAIRSLADAWLFPFARNTYGQLMVASVPGWTPDPGMMEHVGDYPVLCVATFQEMHDLRSAFLAAT